MEDLISVIVPIYNRDRYLHETILSVLNQTYKNLEIILIDDGSSDDVLRIMKHYEKLDKRIKVITQKNVGICLTMKNALAVSSGKYIARCDSDDINELDRYEKQLKFLKENNFDMVGCYIKCFGTGSEGQKRYLEKCVNKPMRTYEEQKNRILLGQPITGSTMFCKSEVLKEILPFKKDCSIIEDFYLSVMLHKAGKRISILEEEKLNYRVHNENLSLSGDKRLLEKHTEVAFTQLFKDIINDSRWVIIFRKSDEKESILRILLKFFSDKINKFKIITESEVKEFFMNNMNEITDGEGNVIFYGMSFRNCVKPFIECGKYRPYKNIFLSGS